MNFLPLPQQAFWGERLGLHVPSEVTLVSAAGPGVTLPSSLSGHASLSRRPLIKQECHPEEFAKKEGAGFN